VLHYPPPFGNLDVNLYSIVALRCFPELEVYCSLRFLLSKTLNYAFAYQMGKSSIDTVTSCFLDSGTSAELRTSSYLLANKYEVVRYRVALNMVPMNLVLDRIQANEL